MQGTFVPFFCKTPIEYLCALAKNVKSLIVLFLQVEPPTELITQLKVPSTDSVSFHSIESFSNYSTKSQPDFEAAKKFPLDGFPSAFNVCHVQSLFTQVVIIALLHHYTELHHCTVTSLHCYIITLLHLLHYYVIQYSIKRLIYNFKML